MRTVALLHAGVWLLIGAVSNPWFVQAWIHPVERLSIRILFGAAGAACVLIGGLIAYKRDDRSFQTKATLIAISSLAALIASEGLARVAGPSEVRLLEPDRAGTGSYRLAKNVALDVHVDNRKIHVATNSEGMRWRETNRQKTNRRRVAFLGDSFTFGDWASSIESSFVGLVDAKLQPFEWEALNFGTSGYGLGEMQLQLEQRVFDFDVDAVVVVIFNGNDVRDTFLGKERQVIESGVAIADVGAIKRLVPAEYNAHYLRIPDTFTRFEILSQKLRLLGVLRGAYTRLGSTPGNAVSEQLAVSRDDFAAYSFWSQVPYPSIAKDAIALTNSTLLSMRQACDKKRIPMFVIALPYRDQVYTRNARTGEYDLELPQRQFLNFAVRNKMQALDLLPAFRARAAADPPPELYVARDIHFNDAGHKLAGDAIGEFLLQNLVRALYQ